MQVKVKKAVLFNFLKRHLNENRVDDNPSGNFISVVEKENPSFEMFQDEEDPITPVEHMSTQLSIEKPPVDDPYYIPQTNTDLASSVSLISKEVPESQIEYFYRKIHQLLDDALDRNDDYSGGMLSEIKSLIKKDHEEVIVADILNEEINLLSESETMRDKLIQSAAKKVLSGLGDSQSLAIEIINDYSEFEDLDPFDVQALIDDEVLS